MLLSVNVFGTTIFKDDFEDGTFDAWSGSYAPGSNSIEVVFDYSKHKSYCFKATDDDATQRYASINADLTQYTSYYIRFYVLLETGFFNDWSSNDYRQICYLSNDDSQLLIEINSYDSDGEPKWKYGYNGGTFATNPEIIEENRWYCWEILGSTCSANGVGQFWLDGKRITDTTGDFRDGIRFNNFQIGLLYNDELDRTGVAYFDTVLIYDDRRADLIKKYTISGSD